MNEFRTPIAIERGAITVSHQTPLLLVGSCFSDAIGNALCEHKFPTLTNPFGTLYNPVSIANTLRYASSKRVFTEADLDHDGERWVSFHHHGQFSHPDKDECLRAINTAIEEAHTFLSRANVLIITFGTAWVYEHIERGHIVANCHRAPKTDFTRRRLGIEEIVSAMTTAIEQVREHNHDCAVIFTVSPVRHAKDGFVENSRSKAALLLAVQELTKSIPNADYFPSFEIMLDDLRDYRFYDERMFNPAKQAQDYIFARFCERYMTDTTRALLPEIRAFADAAVHRPRFPESASHTKFMERMAEKLRAFTDANPAVDMSDERAYFVGG